MIKDGICAAFGRKQNEIHLCSLTGLWTQLEDSVKEPEFWGISFSSDHRDAAHKTFQNFRAQRVKSSLWWLKRGDTDFWVLPVTSQGKHSASTC